LDHERSNGGEEVEVKSLILALPIVRGKEEEWRRFAQELQETYPREYEDLRRRLGVRAERVWLMQESCGEVALAYAEVEAPEEVIRRLAASEEPFDAWFKEKLLELHGYDSTDRVRGPSPSWSSPTVLGILFQDRPGPTSRSRP
jgi:alkanesulfonate monooxygenase SsuD/methylene tetrahydromethanopterin reductase-like flavin-dependent oxidoreductase (luciferase family)